jgi:hypothetical protein
MLVVAVCAINAVGASSASAFECVRAETVMVGAGEGGGGNFNNSLCAGTPVALGTWVLAAAITGFILPSANLVCVQAEAVAAQEVLPYSDPGCQTREPNDKGKYALVESRYFRIAPNAGTVKLTGSGLQQLTLANKSKVDCEKLSGRAHTESSVKLFIGLLVQYSECEAFGDKATVSTGDVLLLSNEAVSIGSSDKLVITVSVAKCSVLILGEGSNKQLATIKYTNSNKTVIAEASSLGGINYEVHATTAKSSCGEPGELNVASYTGKATYELEGGSIAVE